MTQQQLLTQIKNIADGHSVHLSNGGRLRAISLLVSELIAQRPEPPARIPVRRAQLEGAIAELGRIDRNYDECPLLADVRVVRQQLEHLLGRSS